MSKLIDDVQQVMHDFRIQVFGAAEDTAKKVLAIAMHFDIDPVLKVKLESILPPEWTLEFEKQELPAEVKSAADAKAVEGALIRMPNREERRKIEKSRNRK